MTQRRDSGPPLKDRVYTTFYRLRYGWQFRSSFEITHTSPIWILGKCYYRDSDFTDSDVSSPEGAPPHIMQFWEHFYSIPWMTYRANFSQIHGTTISTDCGWGCMVRSGQMILATALHRHLLDKEWRLVNSTSEDMAMHKQILSWFADKECDHCPFSLHNLMRVAKKHGYRPGDWFGPSQVAVLIRDCVRNARKTQQLLANLQAYVAYDCTVYVNDVLDLFEGDESQGLLLLVPVRLGSEALNPIYIPCVKALLSLDHCVGIIGGKPKHSVYFVGFQDDKLVHLDPHYCQSASGVPQEPGESIDDAMIKTYHCDAPRKLTATKMDPSCTIGFYCKNRFEFLDLRAKAEKVLAPPLQKGVYPFFTFIDQRADDTFTDSFEQHLNSLSGHGATMTVSDPSASLNKVKRRKSAGKNIDDDFIIHDNDDFVLVEVRPSTSTPKHKARDEREWSEDYVGEDSLMAAGYEPALLRNASVRQGEEFAEDGVESEVDKLDKQDSLITTGFEPVMSAMSLAEQEKEELVENGVESKVDKPDKLDQETTGGFEPVLSMMSIAGQGEELVENGVESEVEKEVGTLEQEADRADKQVGTVTLAIQPVKASGLEQMTSQEAEESLTMQEQLDASST